MTKQQTSVMRNASIAKEEHEGSDNNNVDRSSSDAISDNDAERSNSHSEIDNESNFDMVPYSRFSHKQKNASCRSVCLHRLFFNRGRVYLLSSAYYY